jgi:glutamate/aspartate transport system substrate-binding protein
MTKLIRGLTAACLLLAFSPPPASAQGLGPALQKIKDSGTITIGNRDSSVPFSYLDDSQKPIGFSLDLCNLVVAKVKARTGLPNLKVAYQAVNSSNRIPLVKNGTVDIECGSTAKTIARQEEVA